MGTIRRAGERKFVMPVKTLPSNAHLDHLKHQARDLMRDVRVHDAQAAQRIREFHPRFLKATDAEVFGAGLHLSDAQLVIARERGFASWTRLKRHVEKPTLADNLSAPLHERIEDPAFRHAVDLLDQGEAEALWAYLKAHPGLVRQRVLFEGGNYFRNPGLLEFAAENPIRHGKLPANIVAVVRVILEAGARDANAALNETLVLVCSGSVARECGVQIPLIDVLCGYGADPGAGLTAALVHGEFEAAHELIRLGGRVDLPAAAALGQVDEGRRLLSTASGEERHWAVALAAQFGHAEMVRLLLDAGEDPNRYNPPGAHSHSTPLHQAALAGHLDVVRLLLERGARPDLKDTMWQGTAEGWAARAGKTEVAELLRSLKQ